MTKNAFSNRAVLTSAAALVIASCVFFSSAKAAPAQAGGVNLYQDVMSHKASLAWKPSPAENYPDDMCQTIDSCSADRSAPKVFVLPVATVDGRKTGRAVYLVKTKDPKEPETVVIEHQTTTQTYFFRLAPDGTVKKTAYLEPRQPWSSIANRLGQSTFTKDQAAFHDALTKPAAAPAQ